MAAASSAAITAPANRPNPVNVKVKAIAAAMPYRIAGRRLSHTFAARSIRASGMTLCEALGVDTTVSNWPSERNSTGIHASRSPSEPHIFVFSRSASRVAASSRVAIQMLS